MATLKALRERWTPDLLTETSARIEREGRASRGEPSDGDGARCHVRPV